MDPFATLGLPRQYDVDLASVEKTHRELSRALHPDKYAGAGASERRDSLDRAVAVNEAFRIVRDPVRRAEALFTLAGVPVGENVEPKSEPAFLMEMLEQREALSDARDARDASKIRALVIDVEARAKETEAELGRGFRDATPETLGELVKKLGNLRFFRRFLEEAGALEESLLDEATKK
jgi:molecular chaperone HscB